MIEIQKLIPRLKLIPEKRHLATLVTSLQSYNTTMQTLVGSAAPVTGDWSLTSVAAARPAVFRALPELQLAEITTAIDRAADAAIRFRAMIKDVSDLRNVLGDPARESAMIIKEQTHSASTTLRRLWREKMNGLAAAYDQLAQALQRMGVPGAKDLSAAAREVAGAADKPPTTIAAADAVKRKLEIVALAVQKLGLEDVGQQFLMAALRPGGTSLKDILKPEVQKLLKDYPQLYQVLRVSFG